MAHGILLLGLNGCGKTTVGRRLAAELGFSALDAEDFYFPAPGDYSRSRAADEAHALMRSAIASGGDFVLSCVRCNLPHEILAQVQLCVVLHLSPEARAQRIHQRQFSRYGSRILPGGDLYEEHQRFASFAAARSEETVAASLSRLECPVVEIDAAPDADEIVRRILLCWTDR